MNCRENTIRTERCILRCPKAILMHFFSFNALPERQHKHENTHRRACTHTHTHTHTHTRARTHTYNHSLTRMSITQIFFEYQLALMIDSIYRKACILESLQILSICMNNMDIATCTDLLVSCQPSP